MTRLSGGIIDRSRALGFSFNGRSYQGHPGDTLASALLANGVRLMGRSFKYHRPRGPLSAGSEEPNALVTLGTGAETEPNTRATVTELYEGLCAKSQNHLGPLGFDVLAINDLVAPILSAGFYYKTFMWPRAFWERVYEPVIRRAAGLGALSMLPDPSVYDRGFRHCDLLVIGAGPAGLMAALTAGRAGARVVLADEDFRVGGRLNAEADPVDHAPPGDWVARVWAELSALENVILMVRTTVFGAYDHGVLGAVERVSDHVPGPASRQVRQTLWRITARRTILAAGATERHIPFANNDRPGIMLAGAMQAYANRWAVSPTQSADDPVVVFTNGDAGHRSARDLIARGVALRAVVDTRPDAPQSDDYEVLGGAVVSDSRGRRGLRAVQITQGGTARWIDCAALGVAGGWSPNVHLASHHRGRPVWDDALLAFVPGPDGPAGMIAAGACAGRGSTHAALAGGARAAERALGELGVAFTPVPVPHAVDAPARQSAFWHVAGAKRAWVDFQNDVTVKDITLAHQENMRPVEHLKRWTTLGMATDQGKTANVSALAVMAELTGKTIAQTGTTVFRPPYTGVSLGLLGGGDTGPRFRPRRLTPTHHWAKARGAVFTEAGAWLRAQYFPEAGETTWRDSVDREVRAVRSGVGLCDVTTLGKIDVQGPDAARFLDRLYANSMATLKVGRVRYGLMLREDGFAYDDGTCARLGETHFVVTTTTANAGLVFRNMEFARQGLWPELDVQIVSTTDAWAQIAVAGPRSRALLERVVDDRDLSNEAFPFMACAEVHLCGGLRARLFRISFSGELAYEIAVPARYGPALMARLLDVGADLGATPYGTEALSVLRIEKGHPAGAELNGQTTAGMLGLARMVSAKKDAVGAVMSRRAGLAGDAHELVGLTPLRPEDAIVAGSHMFAPDTPQTLDTDLGWVTSAAYSPHLGASIGLAMVKNGRGRLGDEMIAANPLEGQNIRVRIVSPHFIDPEGDRLRA